jgi:multiple sugar transport system ATP-binding protein
MASVEIRGVSKSYGAVQILQSVDFVIDDEEFVILVGPSGCGKSTLLRMIAGLADVTAGEIAIGGRVVNKVKPRDRDIAMVFQSYALYPHMSVFENMAFSLRLRKRTAGEIEREVGRAAAILNLKSFLARAPRQLSGGQRQRVAMGRALVRQPKVFLFDEPLSNLDAKLRVQMRTEIKALHQQLRTTTVYVTHDQIEAMTMADRIVVMDGGRIEQIGAPLELYDRPANLFVAGFIGSPAMNLIKGRLRRSEGRPWVEAADGTRLPTADVAGAEGQPVVFGARPEAFDLSAGPDGVEAMVKLVEPTGADVEVFATLAGEPICVAFRERHAFQPGEVIHLGIDLRKTHVFDEATGRRL